MNNKNLKIDNNNSGRRLDNFLFSVYKNIPKSKIYSMIRKGEIRVNSSRIKPAHKLKINDEVRIPPYLKISLTKPIIPLDKIDQFLLSIVYENENYFVVNKEPEISVHSGTSNQFGLIDIARAKFPSYEIDLCHRIDKSTSGCVILSKNKKFLRHFHNQLKKNEIVKKYEALLLGVLKKDFVLETVIDLSKKKYIHKVQESKTGTGKTAISKFIVLNKYNSFSHVEIIITTGRMHQIRFQSANINHPLVNDKKYGLAEINKYIFKETSINRLALHASSIEFNDLDGSKAAFQIPKNSDFDILLSKVKNITVKY